MINQSVSGVIRPPSERDSPYVHTLATVQWYARDSRRINASIFTQHTLKIVQYSNKSSRYIYQCLTLQSFQNIVNLNKSYKSPVVKVNALYLMLVRLQDLCLYWNGFLFSIRPKCCTFHCITHICPKYSNLKVLHFPFAK